MVNQGCVQRMELCSAEYRIPTDGSYNVTKQSGCTETPGFDLQFLLPCEKQNWAVRVMRSPEAGQQGNAMVENKARSQGQEYTVHSISSVSTS